jgi:hypothetical protein
MAGTSVEGKNCKITLGANKVLGVGNWSYSPGVAAELDDTEFGDTVEKIKLGIRKRGSVSFSGIMKKGDTTGQELIKQYLVNATDVTDLRLYEDATSFYAPCQTTGYLSPASTSGNQTMKSVINITSFEIKSDKSGLASFSGGGTVSGDMVEV